MPNALSINDELRPLWMVRMQLSRAIPRSFSAPLTLRLEMRGTSLPFMRKRHTGLDPIRDQSRRKITPWQTENLTSVPASSGNRRKKCLPHKKDRITPGGARITEEASVAVAGIGTAIAMGMTTIESEAREPREIQGETAVADRRLSLHWDEKF